MNFPTNSELRTPNPEPRTPNHGYLSILTAVLLVIVTILAVSLTAVYMSSMRAGVDRLESAQALGLAEAGLERATFGLLSPFVTSAVALTQRYSCAATSFSDQSLGAGTFTVNSINTIPYEVATSLTAAVTSSANVIPVSSIASLATRGRVVIDREAIDYNGTSTSVSVCGTQPCLTGAVRGRDGTTAASHTSGDFVGQYQCDISSQGGVPNLTSPRSKRVAKQSVQLQKGWLVGNNSGGAEVFGKWNGTAWVNEGVDIAGGINFSDIFMLSYADGWAVGTSGKILNYNGSSWSEFVDTGGQTWNTVYCVSRGDCWAGGDSNQFEHYDGTSWSLSADLGGNSVNDIHCVASADCWAVGGSNKFWHWDGGAWSEFADLGGNAVNSVYCLSASNCWAVGASNKFYNYNGTSWSEIADLGGNAVNSVYCLSASNCWAVGESQKIYNYNGTSWSEFADLGGTNLRAVSCYNAQDCWALGNGGVIVHYDGSTWTAVTSPFSTALFGLSAVGANNRPQSAFLADFH